MKIADISDLILIKNEINVLVNNSSIEKSKIRDLQSMQNTISKFVADAILSKTFKDQLVLEDLAKVEVKKNTQLNLHIELEQDDDEEEAPVVLTGPTGAVGPMVPTVQTQQPVQEVLSGLTERPSFKSRSKKDPSIK